MNRIEAIVLSIGFACLVIAVATIDWRLALAVLGVGLMVSVFDLPRVRQ